MRTLDVYVGGNFLRCFIWIAGALSILFSLVEFLTELDDVGKSGYTLGSAMIYVALTLPRRLLDLMPISTLLGGVVALGLLADRGELLAMQAAGISVGRICGAVIAVGAILMLTTGGLAEIVVPDMEQQARAFRARALAGSGVTLTREGFWARRDRAFIHVGRLHGKHAASDLDIFQFDAQGRMSGYVHAARADIGEDRRWVLKDITRMTVTDGGFVTRHSATLQWEAFLSADQVRVLDLPPHSLSTRDLMLYIAVLKEGGQDADRYTLALWRKLGIPLTTGAMVLLALGFVFGSTRNVSVGLRVTLGAIVGVALYFADQVILHLGLLLHLNPIATAMIPAALIGLAALLQFRRSL